MTLDIQSPWTRPVAIVGSVCGFQLRLHLARTRVALKMAGALAPVQMPSVPPCSLSTAFPL